MGVGLLIVIVGFFLLRSKNATPQETKPSIINQTNMATDSANPDSIGAKLIIEDIKVGDGQEVIQ